MTRRMTATLAVVGLLCCFPMAAPACPACRDALAQTELQNTPGGEAPVTRAFNRSILLMVLMPFALLTTIGGTVIRDLRSRSTSQGEA